jgi:heme exporter protein CcmD
MSDFFAMNGYGFYVWSAYGVAALALVIEVRRCGRAAGRCWRKRGSCSRNPLR